MAAGDATAADIPGRYDVVIDGKGYVFLDSIQSSIPFRTHRAIYGATQPFVERQNVSNTYGDNTQDFFLTVRQRDWSLGEQQRFYRSGQDGRYWMGTNIDVTVPGQVTLRRNIKTLTFAEAAVASSVQGVTTAGNILVVGATTAYTVDETGAISSVGTHGLGTTPTAVANDGTNQFISGTGVGTVGVRKLTSGTFSTWSATDATSLAFLNNTLYGFRSTANTLIQYDTAGTATTIFTWQDAVGTAAISGVARLVPYGGKLAIMRQVSALGSELWIYDGTAPFKVEEFPANFVGWQAVENLGVIYVTGSFFRKNGSSNDQKPAVFFYDGTQLGMLWSASTYVTTSGDGTISVHPGIAQLDGGVVFSDDSTGSYLYYNPIVGGIHSIGSYTVANDSSAMSSSIKSFVNTRGATTGYFGPDTPFASSGTVISSLIDFDSSLTKQFRGIKVEFASATNGDGGSVDIAYQTDSLVGSWTTLKTGAVSGTEYTLANVSGHAIAVRITLNKGTSTAGPTLRSMSVRGAPEMPIYSRGEYVLDCTGTKETPRELRDGSVDPLTGYELVQNLVASRNSTAPIQITDKVSGTFTGFIDVNDPQGFDVYEVHPAPDALKTPGSYVVRLTVRGV